MFLQIAVPLNTVPSLTVNSNSKYESSYLIITYFCSEKLMRTADPSLKTTALYELSSSIAYEPRMLISYQQFECSRQVIGSTLRKSIDVHPKSGVSVYYLYRGSKTLSFSLYSQNRFSQFRLFKAFVQKTINFIFGFLKKPSVY